MVWTLLLLSALASDEPAPEKSADAPPAKWVGHGITGGQARVTVTLTSLEDARRLVEVHWDAYDKTTLEAAAATVTECGAAELEDGLKHVGTVERCLIARLPDRHPVYDYEDRTKVRCVFGARNGDPTAACKLQYTGWFPLHRAE